MSELAKSDGSCRSGEDCVSQDKCPEFLDLKEQWSSAAKGTVHYNRLLTRWVLVVTKCFSKAWRRMVKTF